MSAQLASIFHIHTHHSFDCITSPAEIVRWARRHHIKVLAITDHNTIRGGQEVAASAVKSDVQVIIGAEYATKQGDIIGLFLKEEIRSSDALMVIEQIKAQGGVSVLPHPYHGHHAVDRLSEAADMIEVFNARCSDDQNKRALALAKSQNKPIIGGADAHFLKDLSHCICYLGHDGAVTPDSLLHADCTWAGKRSPLTRLHWSQVIKGVKTGERTLIAAHLRALLLAHVRTMTGDKVYGKLRNLAKPQG